MKTALIAIGCLVGLVCLMQAIAVPAKTPPYNSAAAQDAGGSANRWQPLIKTNVRTCDFHSPYSWVPVVRTQDGQSGYLVYAPVDQVPADWPTPLIVSQHIQGFWQFVLCDGSIATLPGDGYTPPVWDFDGETPETALQGWTKTWPGEDDPRPIFQLR